jgi:hypothetical protein
VVVVVVVVVVAEKRSICRGGPRTTATITITTIERETAASVGTAALAMPVVVEVKEPATSRLMSWKMVVVVVVIAKKQEKGEIAAGDCQQRAPS